MAIIENIRKLKRKAKDAGILQEVKDRQFYIKSQKKSLQKHWSQTLVEEDCQIIQDEQCQIILSRILGKDRST